MPSRLSAQSASYQLHHIGQYIIPFEKNRSVLLGKCFLYFILEIFQVEEAAQVESVGFINNSRW
jgi:hypothetical protein